MTSKLVDSSGNPVKTRQVSVVKYKDFVFLADVIRKDERVDVSSNKINPVAVVKEMRAIQRDLSSRFTLLSAGLAILAKTNPELKEFLDAIGLKIVDTEGKIFHEPNQ